MSIVNSKLFENFILIFQNDCDILDICQRKGGIIMGFPEKLKEAREMKNLKQSDLAKLLGVKNTTISNYEKGVSYPHVDTLYKIFD